MPVDSKIYLLALPLQPRAAEVLKLDESFDGRRTRIRLSGHARSEDIGAIAGLVISRGRKVVLNLEELTLVDAEVVRFLAGCEQDGAELIHCAPYIREWISRERAQEQRIPMNSIAFRVNGIDRAMRLDSRTTLLDALREHLNLTGTKKGCDQGTCGACTVIVNGQRILSCLALAASCVGTDVLTIEGISSAGVLHPMQTAFLDCDAFQCGFCTPGQILSAICLLREAEAGVPSHASADVRRSVAVHMLTDEEIRERMSGNICRCGAYPNILTAINRVRETLTQETQP